MVTEGKVICMLCLVESKSITSVKRRFNTYYRKDAPRKNSITNWMKKFKESGWVNDTRWSGWPQISQEPLTVDQKAFATSQQTFTRRASAELNVSQATVHKWISTDMLTRCSSKKTVMWGGISVKRQDEKLPSLISPMNSLSVLMRLFSTSVAKSRATFAAFVEGRYFHKSGHIKETPQNQMSGAPWGSHALSVLSVLRIFSSLDYGS